MSEYVALDNWRRAAVHPPTHRRSERFRFPGAYAISMHYVRGREKGARRPKPKLEQAVWSANREVPRKRGQTHSLAFRVFQTNSKNFRPLFDHVGGASDSFSKAKFFCRPLLVS